MKCFFFIHFFSITHFICISLQMSSERIPHKKLPACKNCIHFRQNNDEKCSLFKRKDILYDEIRYEYAILCRSDDNRCGLKGKYFTRAKDIAIIYNNISRLMKDQYLIILTVAIVIMYFYMLSLVSHIK